MKECSSVRLRMVKDVVMLEAAFDELDNIHNGLMMWKHYGGRKLDQGVIVSRLVRVLV